jgi:putative exosortase-associated protein (TIGR04073 family)
MNTYHHFFVAGLLTGFSLVYASTALANDMYQPQYQQQPDQQQYQQQPRERSYGKKVGDKAKSGITNIATSWLEVPKSIINDSNAQDSNIIYGIIGGAFEGAIQTAGRAAVGIADLVTAPLATKPIVRPQYIWEDFDQTNIYGDVFRLDSNGNGNEQQPQSAPSNNPYMQ